VVVLLKKHTVQDTIVWLSYTRSQSLCTAAGTPCSREDAGVMKPKLLWSLKCGVWRGATALLKTAG